MLFVAIFQICIFVLKYFLHDIIIPYSDIDIHPTSKQGEVLLERVAKEGIFISVETKTALLKVSATAFDLRCFSQTY